MRVLWQSPPLILVKSSQGPNNHIRQDNWRLKETFSRSETGRAVSFQTLLKRFRCILLAVKRNTSFLVTITRCGFDTQKGRPKIADGKQRKKEGNKEKDGTNERKEGRKRKERKERKKKKETIQRKKRQKDRNKRIVWGHSESSFRVLVRTVIGKHHSGDASCLLLVHLETPESPFETWLVQNPVVTGAAT